MRFVSMLVTSAILLLGGSLVAFADTRIGACGVVKTFTPATASATGSITIGTRTFAIASGTSSSNVNPAPKVGEATCLNGTLNPAGQLTEFGVLANMPAEFCGTVTAYTPASQTSPGSITVSATTTFVVPTGVQLGTDVGSGHHCFALGLTSAGDAQVLREIAAASPQPATAATPAPAVLGRTPGGLPSTSTGEAFPAALLALAVLALLAMAIFRIRQRQGM